MFVKWSTAYSNVVTRTVLPLRRVVMKPSVEIFRRFIRQYELGNVQWYGAATGGSVLSMVIILPGNSTSYTYYAAS